MGYYSAGSLLLLIFSILFTQYGPYSNRNLREVLSLHNEKRNLRENIEDEFQILSQFVESLDIDHTISGPQAELLLKTISSYMISEDVPIFIG